MAQTKLQVPMNRALRDTAEELAEEYGYGSLQELIRIFLTSFAQKKITPSFIINDDEWVTPEQDRVLRAKAHEFEQERKAGKVYKADSASELMSQLLGNGK